MIQRSLTEAIDQLCSDAIDSLSGEDAARVEAVRSRLASPLRVAITGRIKAGKSTLLNALVGERLAATGASECTRLVSWYRYAPSYQVRAFDRDGRVWNPPFRKTENGLEIELAQRAEDIDFLDIGWPAKRLANVIFIDTPGLGSLHHENSSRTHGLFEDPERPSQVDAVVYLMRHAHANDISFLEGFRDGGLPDHSPINSVAVLSRADELGGGRLDAMQSAARIAARYRNDPRLRPLAGYVLPVAGLLAETACTLTEDDLQALRTLITEDDALDELLLSVDRFRDPDLNPLSEELRELLLDRFGLFGLRFSIQALEQGRVRTAGELASELLTCSGLFELQRTIADRFLRHSRPLVARSALLELRSIERSLRERGTSAAFPMAREIEHIGASAHELAELNLAHLLASGFVQLDDGELIEAARVVDETHPTARLGLAEDASDEMRRSAALSAIGRWRQLAANPINDRMTTYACEVVVRSLEGIYASIPAG